MRITLCLLKVSLVFAASVPVAITAPIETWNTTWYMAGNYAGQGSNAINDPFHIGHCFGLGCTNNGPAGNLGAPGALLPEVPGFMELDVANAIGFALPTISLAEGIFARQFTLSDNQPGTVWNVTLGGTYSVEGRVSNASFNPSVSLFSFASIYPGNIPLATILGLGSGDLLA